jgi:hypothetical protein
MRRHLILALLSTLVLIFGCGSAQLGVTIQNHSSQPLRNVELNYVSASFGISYLAPDATYQKNVEPLRSGQLQMKYVDPAGKEHVFVGPQIEHGKDMTVRCEITPDTVHWSLK